MSKFNCKYEELFHQSDEMATLFLITSKKISNFERKFTELKMNQKR